MKRTLRNNRAGPDAAHQFVFSNKLTSRLHQNFDDLEGSPPNRYARSEHPKFAASKVNLAFA
jgi:hypothetical protein